LNHEVRQIPDGILGNWSGRLMIYIKPGEAIWSNSLYKRVLYSLAWIFYQKTFFTNSGIFFD